MQDWRESQWPAWAMQDLWSEAEFSALCCGLIPGEGLSQLLASTVNQAREAISRGVLAKTLDCLQRTDADNAARLYGTARHFVPADAAAWAETRFSAFPSALLAAVRKRSVLTQQLAGIDIAKYPAELRAAIESFDAVRDDAQALAGKTPKAALSAWLEANKSDLSKKARDRIAIVANWQPGGGAPETPSG